MARGVIDIDGMDAPEILALRNAPTPDGLPFTINKIGHVVLMVQDLEKSVKFYTEVLGFRVSDVYPPSMVPGRMVFMRCANDHHGVALVGGAKAPGNSNELNHMAFEVSSIDEVLRAREHLEKHNVKISYQGLFLNGFIALFHELAGHSLCNISQNTGMGYNVRLVLTHGNDAYVVWNCFFCPRNDR